MPYKGSNAEKLHNMCLYDLLCRMQKNGSDCVIEQITGTPQNERCEKHKSGWVTQCRACIAAWLNERSEYLHKDVLKMLEEHPKIFEEESE